MKREMKLVAAATAAAMLAGCAGGGSTFGNDVIGDNPLEMLFCAPLFVCGAKKSTTSSGAGPSTITFTSWQNDIGRKAEAIGVHTVINYDVATDGAITVRSDGTPYNDFWRMTFGSGPHGEFEDFEAGWVQVTSAGRALPGHPGLAYANNHYPSTLLSSPFLDIKDSANSYDGLVTPTIAVVANPYQLGWNYQSFGIWNSNATGNGHLGLESFGNIYPPSTSVPSSGSATFTGELAGFYVSAAGKGSIAAANLSVTADFTARSLSFASTGTTLTTDLSNAVAAPELNLAGTLTYGSGSNTFLGTLSNAGGTMSGKTYGKFYGPASQELGGIFTVKSATTAETLAGAYGAKR